MLKDIETLNTETRVIVVYVKSQILKTVIKDKIKERLEVGWQTNLEAKTASQVREIKKESVIRPFYGGQWLLEIEADNISLSELLKEINNINTTSVNVYWVTDYRLFKKIVESDKAESMRYFFTSFYFGRLEPEDISVIERHLVPDREKYIKDKIMGYVEANYTYDIDKVCNLFLATRAGNKVETSKDVIELVGLGGNTVDNFVIRLLTANPKTKRGNAGSLERMLKILEDLTIEEDVGTIKNYMKYTLDTVYEIKELQILGKYTRERKDIPPGYRERKIKMLRRFERVILEQINMARILNLQSLFGEYNSYNAESDIIKIVMSYLDGVQKMNEQNPESLEMTSGYTRRKR